MNGAQQRAELFANVDELMAWKKGFELKQRELIAWQAMVMETITELRNSSETILKGCGVLMETQELMTNRLDSANERIDIANKRIRRLEEAVERLTPR